MLLKLSGDCILFLYRLLALFAFGSLPAHTWHDCIYTVRSGATYALASFYGAGSLEDDSFPVGPKADKAYEERPFQPKLL